MFITNLCLGLQPRPALAPVQSSFQRRGRPAELSCGRTENVAPTEMHPERFFFFYLIILETKPKKKPHCRVLDRTNTNNNNNNNCNYLLLSLLLDYLKRNNVIFLQLINKKR